jgi:hypothetical protein
MFDRGDFVFGNVRIHRELRRRRNGSRNSGACHRGYDRQHRDTHRGNNGPCDDAGDINIVANDNSAGNVNILRNAGHVGNVGHVRLRLKQHRVIVDSDLDIAHRAGRGCSNRNSAGFHGNQQSRGWFRACGTADRRIAHCRHRGAAFVGTNGTCCSTGKHGGLRDHRHRERWDAERPYRSRKRRDHGNIALGASAETNFPLCAVMKKRGIASAYLLTAVPAAARRVIFPLL